MRTTVLLFSIGLLVAGCKNPGADVTPATVEPAAEDKAAPAAPVETDEVLEINPSNTKIEFVGAKVTASHEGGFNDFSGTLVLGDPIETSQIEVTIQTASLYADREKLTKHLKSPDFFDVAKYPTAKFRSTKISQKSEGGHLITGDLSLRSVTMRAGVPAEITVTETEVLATSEFSINRQAFGIKYAGMADDLIRDLVVIKLSLKLPR
ncbi:MAG: YceI family protein [Polyangiales bacterium]